MSLTAILDRIAPEIASVEAAIMAQVKTEIPLLTSVSEYILAAGGKRLRPALVLLSAKLFDGVDERCVKAAQVVEYLHTATLLHDDVVDQADLRRSQKAARNIWGNEASVLVGDYLLSMAFHNLTTLDNLEVLEAMSEATTLMAKGELLQLTRDYSDHGQDSYLEIIFNKTASLFGSAVKMGAALSDAPTERKGELYDYGVAIGMAFQIVDDALDYMSKGAKSGKPLGIDLAERKITLPLIHLLREANPADREYVMGILAGEEAVTQDQIAGTITLMETYGSIPFSLDVATEYTDRARECLKDFDESPTLTILSDIAEFIVERRF